MKVKLRDKLNHKSVFLLIGSDLLRARRVFVPDFPITVPDKRGRPYRSQHCPCLAHFSLFTRRFIFSKGPMYFKDKEMTVDGILACPIFHPLTPSATGA